MPTSVGEVLEQVEDMVSADGVKLSGITLEGVLRFVVLVAVGLLIVKLLLKLTDRALTRLSIDVGIKKFLRSSVRVLLVFILILIVLAYLDIPVTSLVAMLSVAGLALSLAIQNLLSNVAGSLQLLSTKPFTAGDFIEAGGVSGTVQETGIFYTKLNTIDNKVIQIPNSEIAGEKIINFSAEKERRIDLKITASYDAPIEAVKSAILGVLEDHPRTLDQPAPPLVRVNNFGESSIEYIVRVWCANSDYWDVYFDILEGIKAAFDRNGIEMTYNHLNVHMMEDKAK